MDDSERFPEAFQEKLNELLERKYDYIVYCDQHSKRQPCWICEAENKGEWNDDE